MSTSIRSKLVDISTVTLEIRDKSINSSQACGIAYKILTITYSFQNDNVIIDDDIALVAVL